MRFPPTSKGITSNGRSSGTDATICSPGIVTVVQFALSPSSREEGMGGWEGLVDGWRINQD